MQASEPLAEPVVVDQVIVKPNKGIFGKQFKKEAGDVFAYFENLTNEEAEAFEANIKVGWKIWEC